MKAPWRQLGKVMAKRCSDELTTAGGKFRQRVVPAQSLSDKKSYRIIYLENGLKALLISDTRPDGASSNDTAVAMTVDVGNFDDPDDIPGLSHFIEHMLFMGSKKYPKENEFDAVISRHGGSNNAETDAEETLFYFDVPLAGLDPTLDVFSNLFYEPLFLEDTIDRELSAIDSEFEQARQSNDVRCDIVLAQCLNGPAAKFNYGNRESLTKVGQHELQRRARVFWEVNYRAEYMYLAIQAKLPLDDLEALVEKHFAKLRGDGRQPIESVGGRPRTYQRLQLCDIVKEEFSRQVIHVEAIDNKIELILTWPLPSQAAEYKCKPAHFLEQLLDYEGGLIKRLKDLHLIQRAESQIHEDGFDDNSMFSLFCMTLRLSKQGYKNIPVILENIHAYFRMLLREQAKWPAYYEQLKQIYENQFRFQGEPRMMDEVQRLSILLKYLPDERVIDGCHLYFEYDENMIMSLFKRVAEMQPGVLLCSQQRHAPKEVDESASTEHVEYYTQAKYTVAPLPAEWLRQEVSEGDSLAEAFAFPPPNQFVTTDFTLLNPQGVFADGEWPQKIAETEGYELWFKADRKFGLPKLYVNLQLIVPLVWNDIRHAVLLDIFGSMLSRELIHSLHGANIAGYGCAMLPKPLGVAISMSGFSQRLPTILEEVLSKLNDGFARFASEEQFELTKEEMLCSYVNTLLYVDGLGAELLNGLVEDVHFATYDKYKVLHSIGFPDVLEFCEKLFREFRLKCLVQGNATAEGAQRFVEMIIAKLQPRPIDAEQRKRLVMGAVALPKGEVNSMRVAAFSRSDVNSSLCHYYEVGAETIPLDCALQLLLMIMEEPLFDTLRTKKQLGYDVGAHIKYNHGLVGFCVCVVSQENKFTLEEVEAEVIGFVMEEFAAHLEDMDEEDFEESRNALIELKGMPDQDLEEEVQRNWTEICNETFGFDRLEREREWLKNCTKADILELYDQIMDEERRKMFCVQVQGNSKSEGATKNGRCEGEEGEVDEEKPHHDFQLRFVEQFAPVEGTAVNDIAAFKGRCSRYFRPKVAS